LQVKLIIALVLLSVPGYQASQDNCKECDCSDYPLTKDFCVQCCYIQKGTVTSTSTTTVTIAPTPAPIPEEPPKIFKINPRTTIRHPLKVGEEATVYYHKVDGESLATRIDLTDYVEGQLTPGSLPTPPDTACAQMAKNPNFPLPPGAIRVLLGNSEAVALSPEPFVALQINKENIITIQKTKQGMLVSVRLFDSKGNLVAQIIDNHFFVKVRSALQLDQSDPHVLRILDGRDTLLDLEYMNPTTVRILGTLYGPHGTHLDVLKDAMHTKGGGTMAGVCVAGRTYGIAII
jgi:hypothetical protein